MSKSFYKEALLAIVTEALKQPGKPVIIEHTGLNELKKALEKALKQEKLLELYRELMTVKDEIIFFSFNRSYDDDTEEKEKDLEKQIKELENDK